jgi:hypothetical protein
MQELNHSKLLGVLAGIIVANPSGQFTAEYTVSNSGSGAGSGIIDWQITLDGDVVSHGSFRTASVDPVTPLYDVVSILAPADTGSYVVWMKIREDETYTLSFNLSVDYQITVDSISNIDDGPNDGTADVFITVTSNLSESALIDLEWQLLNADDEILESGTIEDIEVFPGSTNVSAEVHYPATAQSGLKYAVSIVDVPMEPCLSNSFASISVTIDSIDTISNTPIGTWLNVIFNFTVASPCYIIFDFRVRNSTNVEILTDGIGGAFSAGAQTAGCSIFIPNSSSYQMANADFQITKRGAAYSLTSNHFNIT